MGTDYLMLLGLEYYVEKQKDVGKSSPKSRLYHDIEWFVKSLGLHIDLIEGGDSSTQLTTPKQVVIPKVLSSSDKKTLLAHLLMLQEV